MSVEQAQRVADAPYTPAMVPGGRLVFVSGQTPFRNGVLPKGGIEEQTKAAIENIAGVLETVGGSLVDVIRCGVFMADINELPGLSTAYAKAFGSQIPTRTAVRAALPGYKVEIDCIALVPAKFFAPFIDESAAFVQPVLDATAFGHIGDECSDSRN